MDTGYALTPQDVVNAEASLREIGFNNRDHVITTINRNEGFVAAELTAILRRRIRKAVDSEDSSKLFRTLMGLPEKTRESAIRYAKQYEGL